MVASAMMQGFLSTREVSSYICFEMPSDPAVPMINTIYDLLAVPEYSKLSE